LAAIKHKTANSNDICLTAAACIVLNFRRNDATITVSLSSLLTLRLTDSQSAVFVYGSTQIAVRCKLTEVDFAGQWKLLPNW